MMLGELGQVHQVLVEVLEELEAATDAETQVEVFLLAYLDQAPGRNCQELV